MPNPPRPAAGTGAAAELDGLFRLPVEDQVEELIESRRGLADDEPDPLTAAVKQEPERMLLGLARQARDATRRLARIKTERNTLMAEYKLAEAQLQLRLGVLNHQLEWLVASYVEDQQAAGVKKPRKSLEVPGAGTLKLTKVPAKWRVADPTDALSWLEATEGVREDDYVIERRELNMVALLEDLDQLMKVTGGEIPAGVEHADEYESFSFRPA